MRCVFEYFKNRKMNLCKCGCEQEVKGWNYVLNRPITYIHGHNGRGTFNGRYNPELHIKKLCEKLQCSLTL